MSRLINPYQTFRDNAGEVLASGTLTFYVNGDVTTQKNIYTTDELTTAQSNPYTLDAYGRVIGDVWLDGTYSVVVKDSDGATVRTINDVEDLSSTSGGGGETVQGSIENKFINGACRVASEGGSVSISGSYQEGQVADINVKAAGTPTNGTVDLVKTTSVGTSGYALEVTDLTTGGGGTVDYRFRFNSVDSRDLVSGAAIFQCNVLQNTGAAKTYTISIYKATAEDNFSSTTLIGQSSGTSVSDSTDTKISYSIANMGDCSNGIEIILSVACGAVTTKDFYVADIVFRKGQAEIVFEQNPYPQDYASIKFAAVDATVDAIPSTYVSITNLSLSYKSGLALSWASTSTATVASGKILNSTQAYLLNSASSFTKDITATFATGTGNGGRSNNGSTAALADVWYGVYLLGKSTNTSSCDVIFATTQANALADTVATAAGFDLARLVGYVKVTSSAIVKFLNGGGNTFDWDVMKSETISASAARALVTSQTPPFQVARVQYGVEVDNTGAFTFGKLTQTGQTDTAPSISAFDASGNNTAAADPYTTSLEIKTDGSSQFYHRESATTGVTPYLFTRGYKIDPTITDLV